MRTRCKKIKSFTRECKKIKSFTREYYKTFCVLPSHLMSTTARREDFLLKIIIIFPSGVTSCGPRLKHEDVTKQMFSFKGKRRAVGPAVPVVQEKS